MKKTILVTGCNGFIGKAFIQRYHEKYHIIGVDMTASARNSFCDTEYLADICDAEKIKEIFSNHQIDVVLHTAAEKSLIKCEEEQERSFAINYMASVRFLELAEQVNSKFIFISSDQVFDGSDSMYPENAPVHAINYYGKLKIMMEHQLLQHPHAAICRTALVFGDIPDEQKSYFDEICYQDTLPVQGYIVQHTRFCLEQNRKLILPDDEFVSPTHVMLLAEQIDSVISHDVSGILHCCGKDRISRYEMGMCIASHYQLMGNKDCIQKQGQQNPLRPKDVSLECSHTEQLLQMKFMSFAEMLKTYM